MKNMKLKTLLLLIPLVATGCGSGGNNSSQATSSQQTSTSTSSQGGSSSKSDIKNVTIRFWHTFGQSVVEAVTAKMNTFKNLVFEHDGVNVEFEFTYQGSYDDISTKIKNGFATGNIPTISVAYPDNVAYYLEESRTSGINYVANLDEFINDSNVGFGKETWLDDRYNESDFVPEFYNEGKAYIFDGTYSLPFMKSTEIMFYNYDMLELAMPFYNEKYGTEYNTETKIREFMQYLTWDEFIDLCKVIGDHKAAIGNMLTVPAYYDSDSNFFISKMFQNEIAYASIAENGRGVIDFAEQPAYQQTVDMLKDLRTLHDGDNALMTTKGIVKKYGSDYFKDGKSVFSIGSSGGAGYNFPEQDDFKFGVCRVPYSNDNPMYVSQGPTLCMFNNNEVTSEVNYVTKLYAWRFLKYITNAKSNVELCINGSEGYLPVRNSAYTSEMFQEFMEEGEKYAECYKVVLRDINNNAEYLISPAFKGSDSLRDEVGSLLTSVLLASSDDAIPGLLDKAIENATLKM